jgi:peptidoglycan/LPS O-acetylase OafA/YrhL
MTKSSTYRADIQGLRAIAVLLVLLFHFETRLKGGYLGVDMFFVISGFVIASSTLREIDHTNTFSWSAFLHRRIRRLLPGIAVVAVAASVLSMLLLSPFGPQQETAKMLLSAASYTSNFVLMPQSYFSLDPKANPLLHLWSLAVEEQFYFVWPIAIILLIGIRKRLPMRMFKPLVWVAVFGVVLASCWLFLVCSVNGSEVSGFLWFKPFIQWDITPEHFAFYSPFTRAWEFVAGVLAALLLRSKLVAFVHKTGPLIVFCGVALVLFGVAWASKFPEIQHDANWSTNTSATLVVVAGTMLWIIGGIRENFIRRFMSLRPFTLIGDCSYSIYLLHWPIWVLLITSFKQSNYLVGIAFSVSLILGSLQFRFVEEPIRSKSRIPSTKSSRFVGVFGVVASVGFVAMSLTTPVLGLQLAGIKPDEISLHITEKSCAGERYALDSAQSCVFGSTGKQGTAILVGDSMAKSLSDGFVKAANSQEMNAYVFLLPGCAYEMSDSPFSATNDCARWRADVLSALQQLQPKVVIIANLNSLYVEQSLPNMTIEETQFTWGSELTRTLEGLSGLGAQVIIAQPPPQFAYDLRYNTSLLWPDPSKEPRDVVVARREGINAIEVNATTGIEYVVGVFNFDDIFCNAKLCDPQVENKFMFEDGDHLSVDGSLLVESKIRKQIRLALMK